MVNYYGKMEKHIQCLFVLKLLIPPLKTEGRIILGQRIKRHDISEYMYMYYKRDRETFKLFVSREESDMFWLF